MIKSKYKTCNFYMLKDGMINGGMPEMVKNKKKENKIPKTEKEKGIDLDESKKPSHFSLVESDSEMNGKIMDIREKLKNQPEVMEKLFSEYKAMVDQANEQADEISKIYDEIFSGKIADKNKIIQTILKKSSELLWWASEELYSTEEEDKSRMIEDLIIHLQREARIKKTAIENLKNIALELNEKYKEINKIIFDIENEEMKRADKMDIESEAFDYEEDKNYLNELLESIEAEYKEASREYDEAKENRRYDSQKLKNIIKEIKRLYSRDSFIGPPLTIEMLAENWGVNVAGAEEIIEKKREYEEEIYKPMVDKLEKLLKVQESLESQLEEFIYGEYSSKEEETISAKIFAKYNEILEGAKNTKNELKKLFKSDQDVSDKEVERIVNLVLEKARIFLDSSIKELTQGEETDEKHLLEKLENYNENLVLTASIIKEVQGISPEDLKGVSFERLSVSDLTHEGKVLQILDEIEKKLDKSDTFPVVPGRLLKGMVREVTDRLRFSEDEEKAAEQILRMAGLYQSRYNFNKKLQKELLNSFRKRLEQGGENVTCYLYKKDDEIISFLMFDKMENGKKYFSSFNAVPEAEKTGLGMSLLRKSLEIESPESEIEADTNAALAISSKYIGKEFGFVGEKSLPNYQDTGVLAFNIKRKKENEKYYYFDYDKNDLEKEYENNIEENTRNAGKEKFIARYEYNSSKLSSETERWINNEGYVMTNYVFSKDKKFVYCAFEKKKTI